MGVLGSLFGGIYYATSGPKKPAAAANIPPINASSSDEADFIKCANSTPIPFPPLQDVG
jgi:F-type H+-transporting ATPase subunit k